MSKPNLKGIGKNQEQTIKFMKEGCILLHIQDYNDYTQSFSIEDELDLYKEISLTEFNSLLERNIIYQTSSIEKSINVFFITYKLNLNILSVINCLVLK